MKMPQVVLQILNVNYQIAYQSVIEAKSNFCTKQFLELHHPISHHLNLVPQSVLSILAQLHFGHCRLLNTYKAHITTSVSDVWSVEWHHTP